MYFSQTNVALILLSVLLNIVIIILAKPATFQQDFKVTWSDSHLKFVEGGSAIQLILDPSSGCGFASKYKYMFGRVSMKIKLVTGDSAGTVTAFYMNSDTNDIRDELDFEFLGNRTGLLEEWLAKPNFKFSIFPLSHIGQPYTVQTNIYVHGKGGREQRINLWFDPSLEYHTYSFLWSHNIVVFFVDEKPIRVHKYNKAKGNPFPNSQPMGVYSTLWDADNWATRGGLEKIDWSKAPFLAYYKDFDIEGCAMPGPTSCASNLKNWWEGPAYQELSPVHAKSYQWVRMNHMVYDYCSDKSRYPTTPPEC